MKLECQEERSDGHYLVHVHGVLIIERIGIDGHEAIEVANSYSYNLSIKVVLINEFIIPEQERQKSVLMACEH